VRLELEGSVNIVEVKNGKTTSTPLDGMLVLKLLMRFLEEAVREACKKDLKKKTTK
jgi:hypothetical protein